MLNFNQFRIFYHAAKYLNFTRAARALYISQPAVTIQIKAFEDYCGLKLFKKRGRLIRLTDEGQTLFAYAEKVFGIEKKIESTLEDLRSLKRGILKIGTTKAYARYFMPIMLTSFLSKYPDIKIELNEGSSLDMTNSLLELKNEVGIIAKAEDIPGIELIPFSQEEMALVVATAHPWTRRKTPVSLKELANEPFILKEVGSGTRRLVDRLFEQQPHPPEILMETSNTEFIKELVQRGEGVSLLVKAAVSQEINEGKLSEILFEGGKVYLDISIAYLQGQQLSPSAMAFLETLENLQYRREITPQGIGKFMAKILSQQKKEAKPIESFKV